jgi:hypothetical protein
VRFRMDVIFSPRKIRIWAGWLFWAAGLCSAQTVRPLIDENVVRGPGKPAKGRIEYFNDSLQPLNIVLESKSFSVSETGEISYRPLDSGVQLKLSTMSFRLPPQQSYAVFYEASADTVPAWFVIYASFSGFRERTAQGLRVQVQLPHTIYLLPKQAIQKNELTVVAAEYVPGDNKVLVKVRNAGNAFGRVLESNVSNGGARTTQGGFPLFPQSERQIEVPWTAGVNPSKLVLRLEHFTLEHSVSRAEQ